MTGAVKALEWWTSDTGDWCADTLIGRYQVQKVTANRNFRLFVPGERKEVVHPDTGYWPEEEAKKAAQAHFNASILSALTASASEPAPSFQQRVQPWMMACFGEEISNDRVERGDRLLEEVFELLQSGGYDPARVLPLRDYVWSREVGEPSQEAGGVQVTMAAYCLAYGLDMHEAGETELARIWTKVEKIRAKQAAKPKHSPLPVPASEPEPVAWREIDLSKAVKSNHPDISTDKQYLVKVYGRWHFGQFTCQWYGLNFNGWGNSGCQFDAPGYNSSGWERVIEIDPEALAKPVPTPDGAVEATRDALFKIVYPYIGNEFTARMAVDEICAALSHPADGMSAQGTVEPEGWRLVLERGNWEMLERLRELIEGDTTFDVVADALEYVLSASPKCQAEDEEVAPAKRQGVTVQELVDIEASLDDAVRYLVDMAGAKPDPGSTQNCRAHIEQARFYARRLSALQAGEADGWQPIATAPTDGTLVLVPTSSTGLVNVVSWNDGGWRETANYLLLRNEPKVWHPLPAAPLSAKPEGE